MINMMQFTFINILLIFLASVQAINWRNVKPQYLERTAIGDTNPPSTGYIIGGSEAAPHQFPYQAAIFLDGVGFCGGSLINDYVVMFAAHCTSGWTSFEVHLGAHNLYNLTEPDRQIVISSTVLAHENWDLMTIDNDLALLFLPYPVTGTGIATIRMPSRSQINESFSGWIMRASGWGRTSDSSTELSPVLKYADVLVISNEQCTEYFGTELMDDSKICIETSGGTNGVCGGDSGGPLAFVESDGIITQIGVISFGSALGCEVSAPYVLTRLTSYLDWLESNAGVTIRP
ncbi:hypothetical protein B566_EDAN009478 [Ephemera danica]|nr:hypothetical protein B566_EDAN009478 [Ephemera danica]